MVEEMRAEQRRGGVAVAWHRVDLGFVSAYVLVRGGEAAIVDTGIPDSEGAIGRVLDAAGVGWGDVGHVILTHKHGDHVGSAPAVLALAPDAEVYAGEEDIPAITSPRPVVPVRDGDRVFDLRIVATPGHTPGHVCVLDEEGGHLLAGDAIRGGEAGGVVGPNPQFTEDMETAIASVRRLASLEFATALFGHGEPVEERADAEVAALAGTL